MMRLKAARNWTSGGLQGNATRMPGFYSFTYDLSNRLASASPSLGVTEYYAYETTNQRVWRKKTDGTTKLATYHRDTSTALD